MVIGKAGTGKTALIEYLAQLIATDNVPSELKGKRIISLSSTTLTAGTIYRGQLEQRVQDICEEVSKNPDIIVFIDEFHSAVSDGSSDISQMLKPSLSRGELTLIAGTTYDEYKKFIEKDSALKRRFQKVYIEEPGRDETFLILQGLRDKYEEYHNVNYPDSVLQACVDWSAKYLYDRNSPDRAIDLMDVSGSRAKLDRPSDGSKIVTLEEKIKKVSEKKAELVKKEKFEEAQKERDKQKELEAKLEELKTSRKKTEVTMEDVAKVVSELVNIPVEKIMNPDLDKLRNMAGLLKEKIIGQDESIEAVTKLLSKQFLGLRDENIPPSLYISGGTGTGKTYLAEEIAKTIFGTEKAMLRIDCGELSQPHTVTKLIGAPPSYVGFGEVALFDKVRERPQQLILVDEADKLCDEILNTIFLNILTTGFITLSNGVEVSFKDCIFIFTSNDGTRDLEAHGKGIGFGLEDKRAMTKEIVMKAIKRRIRPEVINRFSGIIIFNNLGVEEMKKIYVLELRKLEKRLEKKGLTLSVSDDVRDKIISELDLNYGARDLTRGIAKWVEDPICDKILEESIGKKSKVDVSLGKDGMVCVKFKK
jgi:ATP-dependent Clp protease ATP-binding subunit ClpC